MSEYPLVSANLLSANTSTTLDDRSILIVGQKISGSATSGELKQVLTKQDLINYFGASSHLTIAGKSLFDTLAISSIKPKVSAIGLDDNASGSFATGSFAISGTATESGKLTFYINSIKNGVVDIAIASGDSAVAIATKLDTAINGLVGCPASSVLATSTTNLTAKNKGLVGNDIGLKVAGSIAGISVVITAMNGGAGIPNITGLFDSIVNSKQRFTTIIYPAEYTLSTLTQLTESRFNVDNQVIDGVGLITKTDTYANNNSFLDGLNLKTLIVNCNNKISTAKHKGGAIFEHNLTISAVIGAIRELRLTVGSNITKIMSNNETAGGSYNAAIPYFNTIALELPVIEIGNDYSDEERQELKASGGSCPTNASGNFYIEINKQFTTYKLDNSGNVDKTYQSLNTLDTMSIVREYIFKSLKADFPQHSLTQGQLVSGRKMVNKASFIASLANYYIELSGIGGGNNQYALLPNDNVILEAFKSYIEKNIVIDLQNGKITAEVITAIVTQLEQIILNIIPQFN